MNSIPGTSFDSAAAYDAAAAAEAKRLNIPLDRLSYLPLSGYADAPILVWSDRQKPAGIEYASTTPTPISHTLPGLATEVLYSTVGDHLMDREIKPQSGASKGKRITLPGTFTYWADPTHENAEPSLIARTEKRRIEANDGLFHRGPAPIIVDTPRTLARLVEALRDLNDPLGSVAARTLKVGGSLTYCPEVIVLTRAATLRYYITADLPVNSLATWLSAFQIAHVAAPDDMMAVWDRLLTTNGEQTSKRLASLVRKESAAALETSSIAAGTAAIRVNAHCESATAAFAALETIDPNLRARSLASGDLLSATIAEPPTIDAAVLRMTSDTLRMKRRDRLTVRIQGRDREFAMSVRDVRVDTATGTVTLKVSPSVAKKRTSNGQIVATEWVWSGPEFTALCNAYEARNAITAYKSVMSSFAGKFQEKRWIRSTKRERIQRKMPMDVAIASRG